MVPRPSHPRRIAGSRFGTLMAMTRRSLFALAAAFALDPERALWVPGSRLVSVPKPRMPDRWLGPLPTVSVYFSSAHLLGWPSPDCNPEDRAAIFRRYSPDEARALIAELRRQHPFVPPPARIWTPPEPPRQPPLDYECTTFYRFPVTDPQIAPA